MMYKVENRENGKKTICKNVSAVNKITRISESALYRVFSRKKKNELKTFDFKIEKINDTFEL